METDKFVAIVEFFTILGFVVWAVINYWNKRELKKQIWKLKTKLSFLENISDLMFPEWEILENLSCDHLKSYSSKLTSLFFNKFFQGKIDLKKIGEYLEKIETELSCSTKKELIKDLFKSALILTYFDKMAEYIALSTKEECVVTQKAAIFIIETVKLYWPDETLKLFLKTFNQETALILFEEYDPNKRDCLIKRANYLRENIQPETAANHGN